MLRPQRHSAERSPGKKSEAGESRCLNESNAQEVATSIDLRQMVEQLCFSTLRCTAAVSLIQREIFDPIHHILRAQHLTNYFEIQHILPNSRRELMSIDKPCKRHPLELVHSGNGQ